MSLSHNKMLSAIVLTTIGFWGFKKKKSGDGQQRKIAQPKSFKSSIFFSFFPPERSLHLACRWAFAYGSCASVHVNEKESGA